MLTFRRRHQCSQRLQSGVERALYKGGSGAGGGRGHKVNALLEEQSPVVRHDARPDLLSLRTHARPASAQISAFV